MDLQRSNEIYTRARTCAQQHLRSVVDELGENVSPTDKQLTNARFLAACEFAADVACLFAAYNSIIDNKPDTIGLLRALNSLAFGFETNLFYGTFKGYLHPILMSGINGYIDANYEQNAAGAVENAAGIAWTNIYPAIAFCLGNTSLMRKVGFLLQTDILRIVK